MKVPVIGGPVRLVLKLVQHRVHDERLNLRIVLARGEGLARVESDLHVSAPQLLDRLHAVLRLNVADLCVWPDHPHLPVCLALCASDVAVLMYV